MATTVLVAAAALAVGAAGVAMLLADRLYVGDLLTFFVPQIAAVGLAVLLLAALTRRPRLTALALAALLPHATVLTGSIGAPVAAAQDGVALRVMTFNVLYTNEAHAELIAHIERERPDVIMLQEAWGPWRQALEVLDPLYPWRSDRITGRRFTMLVLSRHPIVAAEWFRLTRRSVYRRQALNDRALIFTIEVDGRPVDLANIHPPTPRTPELWANRNVYLERLGETLAGRSAGRPLVVAGDFNTSAWSPWNRGFLDRLGLRDAAGTVLPAPTRLWRDPPLPRLLGTPIDRIAVSSEITVDDLVVGPDLGSDHLPVTADLRLPAR